MISRESHYGTFEDNDNSTESLGLLEQAQSSRKTSLSFTSSGHEELSYSLPSVSSTSSSRRPTSRSAHLFLQILSLISDVGVISILVCFQLMIIALFALSMISTDSIWDNIMKHVMSCAMFGFVGGITNWCAVTMLFKEVPGLGGTGVFSKHYKEICYSIKETLMLLVFDKPFLAKYLSKKVCQTFTELDIEKSIEQLLQSETFDQLLEEKIRNLHCTAEGHILEVLGTDPDDMKSFTKPFILDVAVDLAYVLSKAVTTKDKLLSVEYIQEELDMYMLVCLDSVSKQLVTQHMQLVLRRHLSWVILWGTVFGAVIGLIAGLAGIAPNF